MYQRIKDKIRERILTIKIEDLYNTIGKDDILRKEGNSWWVGDRLIPIQEMKLIIAEAQMLKKSRLWKVLQEDVKYQANAKMFDISRNIGDLTMGKSWTWVLDCFKTRINEIAKIK